MPLQIKNVISSLIFHPRLMYEFWCPNMVVSRYPTPNEYVPLCNMSDICTCRGVIDGRRKSALELLNS